MGIRTILKNNYFFVKRICAFRKWRRMFRGVNWYKTIYLNYKTQEYKIASKLPILVYGKLDIVDLSGTIVIKGAIRTGMIRLGLNTDKFSASKGCALLILRGSLIFEGPALISVDYTFDVIGICTLGALIGFGNGVRIRCWEKVVIGEGVRIAVDTQIVDTNFHYTRNVVNGKIVKNKKEIIIGRFCWIGNRTSIMKGTYLPDYSIVASNSLLNKDYTKDAPDYPMYAGTPAKLVNSGFVRVFDVKLENEISEYFKINSASDVFQGPCGVIDETEIVAELFKNQ